MGNLCNSTTNKKSENNPSKVNNETSGPNSNIDKNGNLQSANPSHLRAEKKKNPHSIISGLKGQVVIKYINDINGDAVRIDNCTDSTIIIMDFSAQVMVHQCSNCNFFFAPCKGSILIRKSENLNLISASGQLRCTEVTNCKASVYVNSQPALENVKQFSLSCFFFMYTLLPDMFNQAELIVWDNSWSEYINFTPGKNQDEEISYFNARDETDFIANFSEALKDAEIQVEQYYPVPFTNGLSNIIHSSYQHLFIIFRESSVDLSKIYDILNEDFLNQVQTSLIRTSSFNKNEETFNIILNLLKTNNSEKTEFFNQSNFTSSFNKKSTVNLVKYNAQTNNNNFVLLWFVNSYDEFNEFLNEIFNQVDNLLFLNETDLGKMEEVIKKIFKKFVI